MILYTALSSAKIKRTSDDILYELEGLGCLTKMKIPGWHLYKIIADILTNESKVLHHISYLKGSVLGNHNGNFNF